MTSILQNVQGVESVDVQFAKNSASVKAHDDLDPKKLIQALKRPYSGKLIRVNKSKAKVTSVDNNIEVQVEQKIQQKGQSLISRDDIRAIHRPNFVSASKAKISSDSHVLGVRVGKEFRAYNLDLLNLHEVVNDKVGKVSFAVVWSPLSNTAIAINRTYNEKQFHFVASDELVNAALILTDQETNSRWSIMEGKAISGKMAGTKLSIIKNSTKTSWSEWKKKYPNSKVLSVSGEEEGENLYKDYFKSSQGAEGLRASDYRLRTKKSIFAFQAGKKKYAIAHSSIVGGKVIKFGKAHIFLYRKNRADLLDSTYAYISLGKGFEKKQGQWFSLDTKKRVKLSGIPHLSRELKPFKGFDTFWYNWSLTHPEVEILK